MHLAIGHVARRTEVVALGDRSSPSNALHHGPWFFSGAGREPCEMDSAGASRLGTSNADVSASEQALAHLAFALGGVLFGQRFGHLISAHGLLQFDQVLLRIELSKPVQLAIDMETENRPLADLLTANLFDLVMLPESAAQLLVLGLALLAVRAVAHVDLLAHAEILTRAEIDFQFQSKGIVDLFLL